jgi:hypothetical protein
MVSILDSFCQLIQLQCEVDLFAVFKIVIVTKFNLREIKTSEPLDVLPYLNLLT